MSAAITGTGNTAKRLYWGYQAELRSATRKVLVIIQRRLRADTLARLDKDLCFLTSFPIPPRYMEVYLEVPLSRSLSAALSDFAQRYELSTTVSVPSILPPGQAALHPLMAEPGRAILRVVIRPSEDRLSPHRSMPSSTDGRLERRETLT